MTSCIVLDANILIRAVLGQKVGSIIEKYALQRRQFFTPDVCYEDALKYLPTLFEKRNLPPDNAIEALESLKCLICILDVSLYSLFEEEAKKRIGSRDLDDWAIVAAALMLRCPIWTEDKDFFGAGVATWTSDRVYLYLESDCP